MVTTTEKVTKIMVNSRYWLENVKVIEKIVDGGVTIDQHFQKRVSEVGGGNLSKGDDGDDDNWVTYLAEEGHREWCWGDDLGEEEEKHSEREQDGNGERHLQKI